MSTQLTLSEQDVVMLNDCWSSLQNNNKYHKDTFISRLFFNLLAANPKLKKVFHSDAVVNEQSTLFGDLLSFTMVYLDDTETLNQCMNAFLGENPTIVDAGSQYLEPMGSALILTFRQWLGKGKFDEQLQSLWVKVYIYIANSLLLFDESRETRSIEEKPIEALRPRRRPPVEQMQEPVKQEIPTLPVVPVERPVIQEKTSETIKFELASNEKYRGFRRSVQMDSPNSEPISIKVPSTPTFQQVSPPLSPPSAPFDPRRMRNLSRSSTSLNSEETSGEDSSSFDPRKLNKKSSSVELQEEIPERSTRRSSLIQALQPVPPQQEETAPVQQKLQSDPRKMSFAKPSNVISDNSDDEFEEKERGFGYDPRKLSKKKSQSPVISDEESEKEQVSPLFSSGNRDDSSISDIEDDEYNFEFKQEAPCAPETSYSRPTAFDHNSFGIKGLAPIVESEYDETTSSKYDSDEEIDKDNVSSKYGTSSTDADEISSGVSTLSLHNSDFRSSINSGSDATSVSPSPDFNKFLMGHTAKPSTASDVSYMKPLAQTNEAATRRQSSYASLTTSSTPVTRTPSQQQFKQRASLGFMRSSFVLKKEIDQQGVNEPENVLLKPPTIPAAISSSYNSGKSSTTSLQSTISSNNDGCLDLLNSFVPVSNTSGTKNNNNNKTMPSSMNTQPKHNRSVSDLQSTNSAMSTDSRKRTLRSRISSIFSSSSKKPSSLSCGLTSDLASICTVESTRSNVSGFSFFSKRRTLVDTKYTSNGDRKGKKYIVKSVPYDVFA